MKQKLLSCVAIALLFSAGASLGDVITVTNGNDNGPGSLRQAVIDADHGDTIDFASGVSTVTLTSGEIFINKHLTITGPAQRAPNVVVTRSTLALAFRIFNIGLNRIVTISDVTITNGRRVGAANGNGSGGGIANAGTLALVRCVLSDNWAVGGAAQAGNRGGRGRGGAIYNGAGARLTLSNCVISNNTARGGNASDRDGGDAVGGGIAHFSKSQLTITNSRFSNNEALGEEGVDGTGGWGGSASGGGVAIAFGEDEITSAAQEVAITSSSFHDNTARGADGGDGAPGELGGSGGDASGGGLFISAGIGSLEPVTHHVEVNGCTFAGNTLHGGSVGAGTDSPFPTPGSTIGGAIFELLQVGTFTVVNCTLSGNSATSTYSGFGGGIYLATSSVGPINHTIHIRSCTITGNSCLYGGGGIRYTEHIGASLAHIGNSIIWGNPAFSDLTGAFISDDYNVIGTVEPGSTISGSTAQSQRQPTTRAA